MRHVIAITCCCCGILAGNSFVNGQHPQQGNVVSLWKQGEIWKLDVSRLQKGAKENTFTLRALVSGKDNSKGNDGWKLSFLAEESNVFLPRYHVLIDKKQGMPYALSKVTRTRNSQLVAAASMLHGQAGTGGGPSSLLTITMIKPASLEIANLSELIRREDRISFLTTPIDYFPLELFPLTDETLSFPGNQVVKLRRSTNGNEVVSEFTLTVQGKQVYMIRQKWIDGEKWWREYDRFVDEIHVLSARLADAPQDSVAARFPLRVDPKLRAVLHRVPTNPDLPDLLIRLQGATGLTIRLSSELDSHRPDLGYLQSTEKGRTAWQLMEWLQASQLENGKWQKTETGYQLVGKSRASLPREKAAVSEESNKGQDRETPTPGRLWLIFSGGALLLILGIVVTFVFRRRSSGQSKHLETAAKPASNAVKVVSKKKPT